MRERGKVEWEESQARLPRRAEKANGKSNGQTRKINKVQFEIEIELHTV